MANQLTNEDGHAALAGELVGWATLVALVYPFVFFQYHRSFPNAQSFTAVSVALLAVAHCMNLLAKGSIFPKVSAHVLRSAMYLWGLVLIALAGVVVYSTGGIGNSMFAWLFEYALIVSLLVSPRDETTFFRRWRPALFTMVLQCLLILLLVVAGGHPDSAVIMGNISMELWGGGSLIVALFATVLMFWIATYRFNQVRP